MDVNEYMKQSLSLLERIAEGIETLNANGVHVTNFVLPEGTDLKAVGSVVHAQPADKVEKTEAKKEEAKVEKKTEVKKEEAKVEKKDEAKAEVKQEAEKPAETKKDDGKKKVTADDARKALKAYAAIEGNDAAMELLTSLGAGSVSALAEQGDDKLAELVAKCGG